MIKILKNLNKRDGLLFLIVTLFVICQVYLDLKLPDFMSEITILLQNGNGKMNDILVNGLYMILCAFGSLLVAVFNGYIISKITSDFSYNIRDKIFKKVTSLSMKEIKEFSTSSLITRTTNDVNQMEMFVGMGSQLLIKAPITAIWAITKILNKSYEWSILTGITIIILLSFIGVIFYFVFPKFKIIQKTIDKLNSVTRENLTGIRVVRAFNAEKYQENKFREVNKDLTDVQIYTSKKFAIMQPSMMMFLNLLTLSIFFVGSILITKANFFDKIVIFGNMIVFTSYAMQVVMSFIMLAMIFMMLPRAGVSAKRVNEVLESDISIIDGEFTLKTKTEGEIEFRNVSFKYPDADEYLLKDISFKINKGETVAFIGSTGSGKSTLINLIPRFYDVTDGEILVDGINVKDYKKSVLNDKIGYVSQKSVIFSGTVKYNVAYGKKVSKEKIEKSLKISNAYDFVHKMKNKENTLIAQGGTDISGGQKQRISIARAIAKNPSIYIFDDSFSALDYQTDLKLRTDLKKYTKAATSLIVAQRIGTIMHSDKIVVLEHGKIVGIGTHKDLLKKCNVYKEIAYSQLSKEELENEV